MLMLVLQNVNSWSSNFTKDEAIMILPTPRVGAVGQPIDGGRILQTKCTHDTHNHDY